MSNLLDPLLIIASGFTTAWVGSYFFQSLYDRAYERYRQVRWDRLAYAGQQQHLELQKIRVIQPDDHGQLGIVYDGQVYRSLDTYAVFEQQITRYIDPVMERLNQQHKLLLAIAGIGSGPIASQALEMGEPAPPPIVWPDLVRLTDLFTDRQPSIHDLVIGAYPTGTGLDVISLSLHDLMHTLTVGASGWGKSTWLRSLLWQIAHAPEPIEIAAIDVNGTELNPLRDWGKLRYPVARSSGDAIATLNAVSGEIASRKTAFETNAPIASKLTEYNTATGANLPPWLVVIDEGTNLLSETALGEPIRAAVQSARQYGIYILLAGQSAHYRVIPTQIRDNFSSRLCFRTSPASSRVVLDESCATDIVKKGRFYAQLTGQELIELQGPFVARDEFMAALTNGGPRYTVASVPADPLSTPSPGADPTPEEIELIWDMTAQGMSITEIAHQLYGSRGGAAFYKVRSVIEATDEH